MVVVPLLQMHNDSENLITLKMQMLETDLLHCYSKKKYELNFKTCDSKYIFTVGKQQH